MAVALGFIGTLGTSGMIQLTGLWMAPLTPLAQYLQYDLRKPNTYYFYFNLGWTKFQLYLYSFLTSCFIGLIFLML